MRWVERVNGNGLKFMQWQRTAEWETFPEWGPGEAIRGCPICGEQYAGRYMDVAGIWHETTRMYVYHDPARHRDYMSTAPVTDLTPPREPGE